MLAFQLSRFLPWCSWTHPVNCKFQINHFCYESLWSWRLNTAIEEEDTKRREQALNLISLLWKVYVCALIVNNLPIKPSILKCLNEEFCLIWNMPLKYIFSLELELAYYYTKSLYFDIGYVILISAHKILFNLRNSPCTMTLVISSSMSSPQDKPFAPNNCHSLGRWSLNKLRSMSRK